MNLFYFGFATFVLVTDYQKQLGMIFLFEECGTVWHDLSADSFSFACLNLNSNLLENQTTNRKISSLQDFPFRFWRKMGNSLGDSNFNLKNVITALLISRLFLSISTSKSYFCRKSQFVLFKLFAKEKDKLSSDKTHCNLHK